MLYMCTCAYTTLMKMKLLNNYVLVPNHHTDEPTLLFIGSYLCRLTYVYHRNSTLVLLYDLKWEEKTRYSCLHVSFMSTLVSLWFTTILLSRLQEKRTVRSLLE